MKKFIFSLLLGAAVAGPMTSNATLLNVGDSVGNITMTDLNGNTFSLYDYLDQGYTVLIDISATWCPPCWAFDQTHVAETLYEHYGPNGTITPKKLIPIFIEGDPSTNNADLHGTGSNTQGDWVTGNDYPIVDAPNYNYISTFLNPNTTQFGFPTFVLICPNRKVIWTQDGYSPAFNEAFFVSQMGNCPTPTGISDVSGFSSLNVYPNPATNLLNVQLSVSTKTQATISVVNVIGQKLLSQQVTFNGGEQTETINTASLPNGMYILSITAADGHSIQRKFMKQ